MKRLSGIVLAALMVMAAMSSSGWAATVAPAVVEGAGAAATTTTTTRTAPAAPADGERLGARERQANAKGLPDFEGGESSVGIYIGGSALTIALLVILLNILL